MPGPRAARRPWRDDRITDRPDVHVRDATGLRAILRAMDVEGVEAAVFKLKAKRRKAISPTTPLVVAAADGAEQRV